MNKGIVNHSQFVFIGLVFGLGVSIIASSIFSYHFYNEVSVGTLLKLSKEINGFWILYIIPIVFALIGLYIKNVQINERKETLKKFDNETMKLKNVLAFAQKLGSGAIDVEYDLGEDDNLGKALVDLRNNLALAREEESKRKIEDQQRSWATEGLAKFGDILRKNTDNIEEFGYVIISNLVKYLNANQGGLYLINDESKDDIFFELVGCIAYDRRKFKEKKILWGEGLVGRCVLEKETIFLTDVPKTYVEITSGLGKETPGCLLIVPLKLNDEIYGVVEVASFTPFKPYQIEFVEKVGESIASTFSSVKISIQTAKLLKESQEQAKKMAEQEEIMRQSMEELQATQEEAEKQSEQFENFTNSVNHTLIRAEFSINGKLVYANTKFLSKLGYVSSMEVEGELVYTFIDSKDIDWFKEIWARLERGGQHFEGDMKLLTKTGKEVWVMSTFVCVRGRDGEVIKILFLANDITEKKVENLAYQGHIQALDKAAIRIQYDSKGKFINANPKFFELLKFSEEQIKESSIFNLLTEKESETFRGVWQTVLQGIPYEGQQKIKNGKGSDIWLFTTYTTVNDLYGNVSEIVCIANDITSQKEIELTAQNQAKLLKEKEELLMKSQEELEIKLEQVKQELQSQFSEIEKVKIRTEKTLEGALDAILTIDQNGIIKFFNKASESLWEYDRSEVLNKGVAILFSSDIEQHDDFIKSFIDPKSSKIVGERKEVYITTKSGEEISVLFLLSEAKVGEEQTFTAFIQTIEVELF